MSWMFMRGSIWKYLQSTQYGTGNFSHFTSPNIFFDPEPEELVPLDDTIAASADEELDSAVLFGALRGNVVGLRYYTGVVNNNEMVALQREPTNPYDRNAVKVNNVNGDQVGHIKKELAAALAYIMDNKLAKVEGVVPYGANNAFTMPVQLSFWGKEENKETVLDHLKRHGFKLGPDSKGDGQGWAPYGHPESPAPAGNETGTDEKSLRKGVCTEEPALALSSAPGPALWPPLKSVPTAVPSTVPRDALTFQRDIGRWTEKGALHRGRGRGANKRAKGSQFNFESNWSLERAGPSYSAPVIPAVQMTTEQLKTEFDKLFEDLREDNKTREMEPAEAVGTPLLLHQKQALAWMVSRENSTDLPPFWEQRNNFYYNTLTNFAEKEKPENVLGGILADDMGLGKTLAAIALILTNFHDGKPFPVGRIETDQSCKNCSETDHSVKNKEAVKVEIKSNEQLYELSDATNRHENVDVEENANMVQPEKSGGRPKRVTVKKVKYTFSSDSELEELKPVKLKVSRLKEDSDFADALAGPPITVRKKTKKKGTTIPPCLAKSVSEVRSRTSVSEVRSRTTLIVCPLSVLSNWMDQFEHHVRSDVRLNICVYYGADRKKDPSVLSKQDVVLTTYSVLSFDYGNRGESPLHKVKWLRVVLDEGHTIRNPNAQQTKAALDLKAERRWVLTGTPIQNSLKDLWSLLSFFKLKPFTDREWWHRTIQRPVTMGDAGGLGRLQSLLKTITLRRTKTSKVNGKAVLELPERKVFVQHITLSDEERKIYDSVKTEGRAAIGRYFNEGTIMTHYADVLALLVRLRQLCCHPHLVPNISSTTSPSGDSTPEELRVTLVNKMKLVLSSGSDEECAICLDSLNFPVITHCAHVFCKPCICQVIHSEQPNAKCPLCRGDVCMEHLVECPPEESDSITGGKMDREWISSSKIDALMHSLISVRKKDPAVKSIIVSQFTTFLSLIETPLGESGFVFTRLDGSMTQKKRVEAIRCFQSKEPESPTLILLSMKAGGLGLNLTAASRVFLMDPAWNPAAEEQCFDRCHRLGQKREVIITKFITKNSVEENMIKIQDKKRELAAGAFGTKKPNANEIKQARIDEIKTLIDI